MGLTINLQHLRETRAAGLVRRLVHRWLAGGQGWPPVLRRPEGPDRWPAASRNVYVHVPFCGTICPHCPYAKIRYDADLARAYRTALMTELEAYLARPDHLPIRTLYFGGGTPSLTPGIVEDAIATLRPALEAVAQTAIEAHPHQATAPDLARLRHAGVNRISLGLESLDAEVLRRLGRGYDPAAARQAMAVTRAAGFEMFDVNLIFGVPGLTRAQFADTVREVLAQGVDQVSAYPLFTFSHTPAGDARHAALYAHEDDSLRLAMQRDVSEICRGAGFERTSVWSFTRAGMRPYTTVTRPDYIGFGAAAGSKATGWMWFNTFDVAAYAQEPLHGAALIWKMPEAQARADWLYWQVYCGLVDGSDYRDRFGRDLWEDFGLLLSALRRLGLMERDAGADRYRLTEPGAIWVHRMQSLFSLSGIEQVWTACGQAPWPEEIHLH